MKYCETCHSAYPNDFQVCPRDNSALRVTSEIVEGLVLANKYCVLEKLGSGGMATVYRARHLAFNEVRAIKVIDNRVQDESAIRRFKAEAIIARKLQHPHAVRIDDLDVTEDGRPFIVMEYVEGKSLRKAIRQRDGLPLARALNIAGQVAEALAAAHQLGITHRDIKPDNILLLSTGGAGDAVKVLDFGIAKVRGGAIDIGEEYTTTQTGMVVGTPAYLSPEQARGKADVDVDGRADLYALGVVLYEMVTGRLPFQSDTSVGMILHHLHTPVTPAHKARPDLHIPRQVSMLLMKAMAKDREERFQSAEEMLGAIREVQLWSSKAPADEEDRDADGMLLTGVRGSENYEIVPSQMGNVAVAKTPELAEDTIAMRPRAPAGLGAPRDIPAVGSKRTPYWRSSVVATLVVATALAAMFLYRHPARRQQYAATLHRFAVTVRNRFARPLPTRQQPQVVEAQKPAELSPQPVAVPVSAVIATQSSSAGTPPPSTTNPTAIEPTKPSDLPKPHPADVKEIAEQKLKPVPSSGSTPSRQVETSDSSLAAGTGAVKGVVYDAARHPAADVTIEIENSSLALDQSTTTEADGSYRFDSLHAGRGYTLSAIKDGDAQDTRSGVVVRSGRSISVNPPLKLQPEQPPENARLYGKVFNAAGQPASGASIKLENPKLDVNRGAIIDTGGNYSFTDVPPGQNYTVSIIQDGNILEMRKNITVDPARVNPDQVLLLYMRSH